MYISIFCDASSAGSVSLDRVARPESAEAEAQRGAVDPLPRLAALRPPLTQGPMSSQVRPARIEIAKAAVMRAAGLSWEEIAAEFGRSAGRVQSLRPSPPPATT
jgi:hypothetical protein